MNIALAVSIIFRKASNVQELNKLTLTARQYGEVVLPDAIPADGTIPGFEYNVSLSVL
jgi:hypothetical protein